MKKDWLFTSALVLIGILLFLLRATGMAAHIALSLVGLLVLIGYTVLAKKDWKIPALEILMRACYGIALVTGIVIMNVSGVAVLSVIHKAGAALFMVLMTVLLIHKAVTNKRA